MEVNIGVMNLIEKLIRKSSACSDYIDFVPRPLVVANPAKWTLS